MADQSGATSTRTSAGTSINQGDRSNDRIIDKVRDAATAQLSSQKDRATDGLGSISQAVRQSTHQLRDQQHDVIAHYIDQAADQIDRFSQGLRDKDVGALVNDIQQMARRRPALFIGGAFAVGLVGARFLKSSNRHNGESLRDTSRHSRFDSSSGAVTAGADRSNYATGRSTTSGTSAPPTGASGTRSRRSGQSQVS